MKMKASLNTKAAEKKIENLKTAFTKKEAQELGDDVVFQMKQLIAKGISPIRSVGRFPAYKGAGKKGRYPQSVQSRYPGKRDRPVNLKLSGEFLNDLTFKVKPGTAGKHASVEIGYYTRSEQDKERSHRDGTNGQPKRPTIPQGSEQFAVTIQRTILNRLREAITKAVKK